MKNKFNLALLALLFGPTLYAQPQSLHQWVNINTNPFITNLWSGGGSTDGDYTEYVCRTVSGSPRLSGRYVPQFGTACFVAIGGTEERLSNFEVLVDFSGYWAPASVVPGGAPPLPNRALQANSGETPVVHVCRAFTSGRMHIGFAADSGCQIGLTGQEFKPKVYEVLVNPWAFLSAPTNELLNVNTNSASPVYACRAEFGGSIYPGTFNATGPLRGCFITPAGNVPSLAVSTRYELLTSAITGLWVRDSRNTRGSFRVGKAIRAAVDETYLCRGIAADGSRLPGKISGGACVVADNISYSAYEIFVPSPNLNLSTYRIYTKATGRFWVRRSPDQVINTLTQPDTDASRFNFFSNSDGTYRLVPADFPTELLHDENRDGLLKAAGDRTDIYARFFLEQMEDQGSYRLRTLGGQGAYLGERAADQLITGRNSSDNDFHRVLLEPSYPSRLQLSSVDSSFGNLTYAATATKTLTITNPGSARVPLVVRINGAGYSQTNTCPTLGLDARGTCQVTISFASPRDGTRRAILTIEEPGRTFTELRFEATGISALSITPSTLVFDRIQSGQRSPGQLVTLRNISPVPMRLSSPPLPGNYISFSSCPLQLAPSTTCGFVVAFQPTGGTGTETVESFGDFVFTGEDSERTYTTMVEGRLRGFFTPTPTPQPLPPTPRIVNSASFSGLRMAPNSIVSIFGTDLSTQTLENTAATVPTSLGGVTLTVRDDAGTTAQARLFFVSPGQINFLMPDLSPTATVALLTDNRGRTYNTLIAPVGPGIYQASPTNVAVGFYNRYNANAGAIELNRLLVTAGSPLQPTPIPRNPGEQLFLELYGTGLRAWKASEITATVGGVRVPVAFIGAQGQFLGLDQINIGPLPASIPSGDHLVQLSVNTLGSNQVRINLR